MGVFCVWAKAHNIILVKFWQNAGKIRLTKSLPLTWLHYHLTRYYCSLELHVNLQYSVGRHFRWVQWFDKGVLPQMPDSLSSGHCVCERWWSGQECERSGRSKDRCKRTAMRWNSVRQLKEKLRFYGDMLGDVLNLRSNGTGTCRQCSGGFMRVLEDYSSLGHFVKYKVLLQQLATAPYRSWCFDE